MKNLLLLIVVAGTALLGTPCTTGTGSPHVFATCALGDRTFSAFAAVPGTLHMIGGRGSAGDSGSGVLVPFTKPVQGANGARAAGASLARNGYAPQRSDYGLPTTSRAVGAPGTVLEQIAQQDDQLGVVPLEPNLVPLETDEPSTDTASDGGNDSLTTLVLPPDLGLNPSPNQGTDQQGAPPAAKAIVSLDLTEPDSHLTQTPEPATFASIGLGLIALWCLSRRRRRANVID